MVVTDLGATLAAVAVQLLSVCQQHLHEDHHATLCPVVAQAVLQWITRREAWATEWLESEAGDAPPVLLAHACTTAATKATFIPRSNQRLSVSAWELSLSVQACTT